ncbi:hypothetical protein DYBT9275_01409 [Dyadobacter sp. CECT 9275]|uniref:FecR family protein n=1 Tax=Dyadobacter helix TaxID=2822344 RepID=A0A916NKF5_9BACT|nr:FecR family protein [Dyadobacter sp. CECT 9275]CAG4994517.1 hypothetical protein DYBT9275_01409 [Dyadobacter sp. CECT 9275]
MKQPFISHHLLKKYLDSQCTDQEKETVEKWYNAINGIPNYLDTLPEHEQKRLKTETYSFIERALSEGSATNRSRLVRWSVAAAASFLVFALGYFALKKTGTRDQIIVAENKPVTEDKLVTFTNNDSKINQHKLPDGTTVWMYSEASISYPAVFDQADRKVKFSGEGYFDVAHDSKHPFYIAVGQMQIKVLGTSFNVKASANQKIYEISVVSGSVSVSSTNTDSNTQPMVLKPREQAFFELGSERLTMAKIPAQPKKEIYEPVSIVFEGTPVKRVIELLDERFDIKIHLMNPKMAECGLTADFEQQSLPAIMEMLCTSLDASYSISGKTILLDGPSCE